LSGCVIVEAAGVRVVPPDHTAVFNRTNALIPNIKSAFLTIVKRIALIMIIPP
jgi:hypothetical protein